MPQGFAPHQRLPHYLIQPEVAAFFAGIGRLRDRTLFALIYHYGFRVSEVALLQRGDVDLARGRLIVKRVKGGVWTERPLFASTLELLVRYLASATRDPEQPLFSGKRGPLRKRRILALFEHVDSGFDPRPPRGRGRRAERAGQLVVPGSACAAMGRTPQRPRSGWRSPGGSI
jgi:integrase